MVLKQFCVWGCDGSAIAGAGDHFDPLCFLIPVSAQLGSASSFGSMRVREGPKEYGKVGGKCCLSTLKIITPPKLCLRHILPLSHPPQVNIKGFDLKPAAHDVEYF
jgi:hypothetical protein